MKAEPGGPCPACKSTDLEHLSCECNWKCFCGPKNRKCRSCGLVYHEKTEYDLKKEARQRASDLAAAQARLAQGAAPCPRTRPDGSGGNWVLRPAVS